MKYLKIFEAYFPDLSEHPSMLSMRQSIHPKTQEFLKNNNFVNIGWLEKGYEFTKGEVGPEIIEKLKKVSPSVITKGWHTCELCETKEESWEARSSTEGKIPGKNGISYCFPGMLVHYITKHNYLPPQEFLDAVIDFKSSE